MKRIEDIPVDFESGLIPKHGCISIWEFEFGKPGDRIYNIEAINSVDHSVILKLKGGGRVTIEEPTNIQYSAIVFSVKDAKAIRWIEGIKEVTFRHLNDEIEVVGRDINITKTSRSANAFCLYTW